MAATKIKRVRKDSGDTNGDTESKKGIQIPPTVIGIAVALLFNIVRARLKDAGILSSPTGASSSIQDFDMKQQQPSLKLADALPTTPTAASPQSSLDQIRAGGGTRVVSHFIQELEVLTQLNSHSLWEDCTRLGERLGTEVLWLDYGAKPQNVWEELAVQMWKDHPLLQRTESNNGQPPIAGYEYWCNILRPNTPLNWHVDKDEIVFDEAQHTTTNDASATITKDNLQTPTMGAVWYGYPHSFEGGFLELFPYSPHEIPDPTIYADLSDHVERIHADYNRLVVLNVSEWHRVTPLTSGSRYTLAVNIWKDKPRLERSSSSKNS